MKFAIKTLIFSFMLLCQLLCHWCEAAVTLRFQPHIDSRAKRLGEVIHIQNDNEHWSKLSLQSHPRPGEWITKEQMIDWMKQHIGHFEWKWQGKTKARVQQSIKSTGQALLNKAKTALKNQLASQYSRIEVNSLSQPTDSEFALDSFKVELKTSFPSAKRICVWLVHDKKRVAVWFDVRVYERVLVANKDLSYSTPIQSSVFSWEERNIAGLKGQPAKALPQGVQLKSSIQQGTVLLTSQIKEMPLVLKGQGLKVSLHNNSIRVVMDAIALSDGAFGQTITVKNPLNQESFVAKVTGTQQAEVEA